jgi:hypothetical protein
MAPPGFPSTRGYSALLRAFSIGTAIELVGVADSSELWD